MKILTICIPCTKQTTSIIETIESCLIKEEVIELLVVNHQTSDVVTKEINDYASKYPETIKVIDGNASPMQVATGLYFKMLPTKDILDQSSLVKVIETLSALISVQANLDMLVCNFEYQTTKKKKACIDYKLALPTDRIFEWHQIKYFGSLQCFPMEAVIFKTNILKTMTVDYNFETIYASLLYAIVPIQKVKAMFYLDVSLHQIAIRKNRLEYLNTVDECIYYTKHMIDIIDFSEIKSRKMKQYVSKHMNILLARCIISLIERNSVADKKEIEELWNYLQVHNYALFKYCQKTIVGKLLVKENRFTKSILERGFNWIF